MECKMFDFNKVEELYPGAGGLMLEPQKGGI